jgi:hypothetical protein
MAEIAPVNNILKMEDGDTYTPNTGKILIASVVLVGNDTDASTALIESDNGDLLYALAAPAKETDVQGICACADADGIEATVTGTGSYVLVYLK